MKIGDYVRTNLGRIAKITKVIDCEEEGEKPYLNYNDMCVYTTDENFIVAGSRGEIIASSPNIIDLIEVGDYVNGKEVIKKHYTYMGENFIDLDTNDSWEWGKGTMPTKYIKSIVTKEQFERMEYKI